jgi:hypothetical protein
MPSDRQAARNASAVYWVPWSLLNRIRFNSDYAEVDVKPENLGMAC